MMTKIERLTWLATGAQQAEAEMQYVGIFAPNAGLREDLPTISLSDAWTSECVDVLLRYGLIERARKRIPEFCQRAFSQGTITATHGSPTIVASGGAGIWADGADHKPIWAGRTISITDGGNTVDYTIQSVNDAGSQITLTANYTGTGGAGLSYSIGTAGTQERIPDFNAILHYHKLTQTSGPSETEYVLAFTKAHIYLWSHVWSAWILKFTCSSDCLQWDTISFNEQVIATNNVDFVQTWGSTINAAFANLGGDPLGLVLGDVYYLTAAKYIEVFENYVILAYVTINGSVYPCQYNWCSYEDETDWDQTGAGDAGDAISEQGGFIRGLKAWGHYLIIAKETQLRFAWLVTGSEVFNEDKFAEQGCRAAHSMVIDGEGRFYWLADDYTIRSLPGGQVVSSKVDITLKTINPVYERYCEAFYVSEYNLLLISIPITPSATGNNVILWFDTNQGICGKWDLSIAAFGSWTRQETYTIDTIPFDTIDEMGWGSIDTVENTVGFSLDLCSGYDGYGYCMHASEKDNGSDYDGYFVLSTDLLEKVLEKRLGTSIRGYKRIESIQLYMKAEEQGTFSIDVKRDNELSWQTGGSVSLVYDEALDLYEKDIIVREVPNIDFRARHFLIKGYASTKFSFIGMVLGFLITGTR